jgi:hypothetical protein
MCKTNLVVPLFALQATSARLGVSLAASVGCPGSAHHWNDDIRAAWMLRRQL